MHTTRTAADWMAEMGETEATPALKRAFADWLRESPANVRAMLELSLLREDLRGVKISAAQMSAWMLAARNSTNIGLLRAGSAATTQAGKVSAAPARKWYLALAAALVLAIGAATWGWWQQGRLTTRFGEQRIVTLQDGSVVSLNTDSALKVSFSAQRRAIELLRGEAFFRVSRDPRRPFEVIANGTRVEALGTEFNVRILATETLVSVVDGLVEVRNEVSSGRLQGGEGASIQGHGPPIVRTAGSAAARASAWTRGRVEFDAAPLEQVMDEFRRYRHFEVEIADPSIRSILLTGSFDARDPQSALAYIATLPGLTVQTKGPDRFVISRGSTDGKSLPQMTGATTAGA